MRKMEWLLRMVLSVSVMAGCGAVYTVEQPQNTKTHDELAAAEPTEEPAAVLPQESMEEQTEVSPVYVFDFKINLGEEEFVFPMELEELESKGCTTEDDLTGELDPQAIAADKLFYRDGLAFYVQFYNNTADVKALKDCKVGGILVSTQPKEEDNKMVVLPGRISPGISTRPDIDTAYGMPTNDYSTAEGIKYAYEAGTMQAVTLVMNVDTGMLTDIDIHNFVMDPVTVADAAKETDSEEVKDYVRPEILGENLMSGIVTMDEKLYQLPVPVSELLADGWSIEGKAEDNIVKANNNQQIMLSKGEDILQIPVRNDSDKAQKAENCLALRLYSDQETVTPSVVLPPGISLGLEEEKLKELLSGLEDLMDEEETDQYNCYFIENETFRVEILVDKETGKVSYLSMLAL